MPESKRPLAKEADAEFIGWQYLRDGRAFALYTVTAAQHPLFQSTVSETTLRMHKLEIPPTPHPLKGALVSDDEIPVNGKTGEVTRDEQASE